MIFIVKFSFRMTSFAVRVFLITLYLITVSCVDPAIEEEEITAISYIKYLSEKTSERYKRASTAEWAYASNITEYNLKNKVNFYNFIL